MKDQVNEINVSSDLTNDHKQEAITQPQAIEFIKIEKNLSSLGFFTPSSKCIKKAKKKTISLSRTEDGKRIEAAATILPSAEYGLPTTADQDTFFAIMKIITEIQQREGKVTNPIAFTSAQLLHLQGKSAAGYYYQELENQLMRIRTTTIVSENAVYFAGRKIWAKDVFSIIDRIVFFGDELPDGTKADKNYLWLSDWQLENINNNWLLPVDYENYKTLKNCIAKVLLPLLQIWLYASREEGVFEKRYSELCQLLNIHQHQYLSDVERQLKKALAELTKQGYLLKWKIAQASNGEYYKVVFYHGTKFYRDRLKRIGQSASGEQRKQPSLPKIAVLEEHSQLPSTQSSLNREQEELSRRLKTEFGIKLAKAAELASTKTEQTRLQLEAWSYREVTPKNRAGWMVEAIENNYDLPDAYVALKEQECQAARRKELEEREKNCAICDGLGFIYVDNGKVRPCKHIPQK